MKENRKTTSSRDWDTELVLAIQQHMAVQEFLNQKPIRAKLLKGIRRNGLILLKILLEIKEPILGKDIQKIPELLEGLRGGKGLTSSGKGLTGKDLRLLEILLKIIGPTSSEDIQEIPDIDLSGKGVIDKENIKGKEYLEAIKAATRAISGVVSRTSKYLEEKFPEGIPFLEDGDVVIRIPHERGGPPVGYRFACFNTKTQQYLNGPDTRKFFQDIQKHFIKGELWKKLKEEAQQQLSEKLKGRDDYQRLDMEIGTIPEKPQQRGTVTEVEEPNTYDHNRVWKTFDMDSLLEPDGAYVVSDDAGRGKTTFLRHLQLEILQKTSLIPIFLDAQEIEKWNSQNVHQFAENLAENLDLELHEDNLVGFLKEAFEKDIICLVDGLDQTRGGGRQHELLANHILGLLKKNVIIASRPSAVINLEDEKKFAFLRLKTFDTKTQKLYFGKHYRRARELSVNALDLIAIPMLACVVRTLIEEKEDKDVRNRAGLYKRFIDYILKEYKHGRAKLPLGLRTKIRQNLSRISYEALAEEEPFIQKIPLEYCFEQPGRLTMEPEKLTESGLVDLILESSGRSDDVLYFTHQSFQEYLVAEWAKKSKRRTKRILDQMWNPKWKEVIKFLAGMLGEEFILRVYPPRCEDNCIHSRLFLAAECCGEWGRVCETERHILDRLMQLVHKPPFVEHAVASLCRLNTAEAIEFLVGIAVDSMVDGRIAEVPEAESLAARIVAMARERMSRAHISRLIRLIRNRNVHSGQLGYYIGFLLAFLSSEDIDAIIDGTCTRLLPIRELWYELAPRFSLAHIDHILECVERENEDVKVRFLSILKVITEQEVYRGSRQGDISCRLLPGHVETLIAHAERYASRVQEEVWQILAHLACKGVLSCRHMDWLVCKRGICSDVCMIHHASEMENLVGRLSHRHVDQILDSLGDADLQTERMSFDILVPLVRRPLHRDLTKIVALLESDDPNLRAAVLYVLADAKWGFTAKQIDAVARLLTTDDESLLGKTVQTLCCIMKNAPPKQVHQILTVLGAIDRDFAYSYMLLDKGSPYHGGRLRLSVPMTLSGSQIETISGFLDSPYRSKVHLGIELLATAGKRLSAEHTRKIVGLLVRADCDTVRLALRALSLVHGKLSDADIDEVVTFLSSDHADVRTAAAELLAEAKDSLLQVHVTRIVGLLKAGRSDIALEALRVVGHMSERVPDGAIMAVIETLEYREPMALWRWGRVARFASRFRQEHMDRLASYVRSGHPVLKENALRTLAALTGVVGIDDSCVYDVIRCLKSGGRGVRSAASVLLKGISHRLTRQHVDKLVEDYGSDGPNRERHTTICDISPRLLARHRDLFLELLNRRETGVQVEILKILERLADELQPRHFGIAEGLLGSPEGGVRDAAYRLLKNTYELRGLP